LRIKDIIGLNTYPIVALKDANREKLIRNLAEILEMEKVIIPIINIIVERDKLVKQLDQSIERKNYKDIDELFQKVIYLTSKLGESTEPFYKMQLKVKNGFEKQSIEEVQPSQEKKLSQLESRLKILLKNFLKDIEGTIAITICDRDGLIISSESKRDAEDEYIIGAMAATVDTFIDRIKNQFKDETSFFNITTISDKKFAYCSMGLKSILLTISDLSSSEDRNYEYIQNM